LGNLTDADVDNNNFGRLHRKFQKHHQQITSILHNPSVMALLRSLAPVKFHVVVTSAAGSVAPGKNKALLISSTTQDMNRSFPSLKSAATRGAFAKGLTGLNVVVVPESTGAQCTTGDGTPHGINDVIIARAVAFLAEAAKEAIPDDLEAIIPHSIAVVAWAVAKGAELLLDSAHSIYTECKTLQDGDKVDSDLQSIKGSVSTTNSSLTTISSNVTNIKGNVTDIKTTVDGINSHTDIDKDAIITKIGDSAGKTTDAVNTSTTTITNNIGVVNNTVNTINTNVNTANTNINTINTKVDNVNTNIDNSRTTIINNAAANTKALTDLSLRLMIEADLAAPDSATPLALFETPGSKGGGYLELVRTIVVATIGNLAGAGATQANSFLTQADAYYKAGNFKATYAYYRKAYKSAAN
jgi:archaellum component FlaC